MPPGIQQCISQPGIEQRWTIRRGDNFSKVPFQLSEGGVGQATTEFPGRIFLAENPDTSVSGNPGNCLGPENADPHLEVRRLLNQDMFLCREKPYQIAAPDFIFAVFEQVKPAARGDQVQFQLGMMVHGIAHPMAVIPQVSIQTGGQIKALTHATKNDNKSLSK
jgi:hypothetical protein